MTKNKFYKFIRIISIPPILVSTLFIILFFNNQDIVPNVTQLLLSILFLGIIPVLSYPIVRLIPKIKDKRKSERKLSFLLTLLGYLLAFLYGTIFKVNINLKIIYATYLISVVILTFINAVIKTKASGHATSMAGPLYVLIYFKIYGFSLVLIIFNLIVLRSSLKLKRHTLKEYLIGTSVPLIALISSALIYTL